VTARLLASRLDVLATAVRRPQYRPEDHAVGIVHLGLGAFHRAHQACYVDEMLARHGGDWRIAGISCRSSIPRDQLVPQGCLYAIAEQSATGTEYRVIGALADAIVAPENPSAAIAWLARSTTHVITLTITEKAYQPSDEAIVTDLRNPAQAPSSAIGLLAAGLRRRQREGVAAPTLLSCDNLRGNGQVLKQTVLAYASRIDAALAEWIEREVHFPCSVVDRIVPTTTAADRDAAESSLGLRDEALVTTEPFSQWIIEDSFAGPRPPLDAVGARFVRDVHPFETAKLRLLNGSHSTLAYVGLLAGHKFVHEAVADPLLRTLVEGLMTEDLAPTLPAVDGLAADHYIRTLLARFANPALHHRLEQIAIDGSQKLPQRLLAPLRERIANGQTSRLICFAISAWMSFIRKRIGAGNAHALDDPLRDTLGKALVRGSGDAANVVGELLDIEAVFGADLRQHAPTRRLLAAQLAAIDQYGIMHALNRLLGGGKS